ncbi:Pyridoxal phosphate-dependent transferase major region subdomain 2 [Penicillium chermesinum]|nr:Pyridoxal phosphate-dependent transferase major region subdomain 2 [Penicillium chermesinum]
MFDVTAAPFAFPALQQKQVYMDNAGGSQVLGTVVESIRSYLLNTNVQLGATYPISKASTSAYMKGYEAGAKFINAEPEEISIGVSTTQLLHNLSTALKFEPGDELILSKLNHEANTAPWGTISPIREIADAVHAHPRALLCVDGVALAPHRQVDVKALGVDFYAPPPLLKVKNEKAFSWYKVYGPHLAQLYASTRIHDQIQSLAHFFKATDTLDLKLNLASANYELTQSIPHVVEYFGSNPAATWAAMAAHEERLQEILLAFLTADERITIIGDPSPAQDRRVPVISFIIRGMGSQQLVEAVEARTVYGFRSGHMYSHRLLADVCGLANVEDGVVRVSFLHYNTAEAEVRGLVEVLGQVLGVWPSQSRAMPRMVCLSDVRLY